MSEQHHLVNVVVAYRQTCSACPSQWEGELSDGRTFYGRYRWGHLSLGIGESMGSAVRADTFGKQVGPGMGGVMSTDDFKRHTAGVLVWPQEDA